MNPTQKSEADFVSIDGSPPIPESEARDIVHSVFSAFIESSPKGLYASKYAPQNYKAANEKQQTKVDKPQDKGRGLNASKHAPKNTEKPETQHNKTNKAWTPKKENGLNASKHAPQNWEKAAQTQRNQASGKQRKGSGLDASKHAPQSWEKLVQTYQNKVDKAPEKESGLNAGKPPANTANESRYRDNGLGASKHAPKSSASPADTKGAKKGVVNFDDPSAFLAAMNRSFAENGGSKPTSAPSRQVKGESMKYSPSPVFPISVCYYHPSPFRIRSIHPYFFYNMLTGVSHRERTLQQANHVSQEQGEGGFRQHPQDPRRCHSHRSSHRGRYGAGYGMALQAGHRWASQA